MYLSVMFPVLDWLFNVSLFTGRSSGVPHLQLRRDLPFHHIEESESAAQPKLDRPPSEPTEQIVAHSGASDVVNNFTLLDRIAADTSFEGLSGAGIVSYNSAQVISV